MENYEPSFEESQNEFHLMLFKKNEELQSENRIALNFAMKLRPMIYSGKWRLGKYMKIFSFIVFFTGVAVLLNSCAAGYVTTEPSVVYYERPVQPHASYVWIDGDWNWNNTNHVYVQNSGYWEKPRPEHSYVSGHWQTTQHGKSWSKGYWEKNKNHDNGSGNHNKNHNHNN